MSRQPCLPVSRRRKRDHAAGDFANVDSMDATEYLNRVTQEADNLPEVFVSSRSTSRRVKEIVPIEGSVASLSYLVSDQAKVLPPPTKDFICQTKGWLEKTLSNFSSLRSYLDSCKQQGGPWQQASTRQPVPAMKDRSGWHMFCVGKAEANGNTMKTFGVEEDLTTGEDKAKHVEVGVGRAPWSTSLPEGGYDPKVSLTLQMDQVMIRNVLSHLVHYTLEGWSPIQHQRCKWIYALLARIELPIHRDDAAVLYSLLKVLCKIRSELGVVDRQGENLARVNILIAIVGLYFNNGQNVMEVPSSG